MRKVIMGRVYDTEKATEVAYWSNGLSRSDFNNLSKSLYRTSKGNWFVAGEGGAFTEFSQAVDSNSQTGGEGLYPVDEEDAMRLLEQWGETEALEEYFGDKLEEA